ncbi:MAG TPA: sigma-70 family RNA polymerase sigma factor [Ignavibacteriaceae bacterium]|nr:sigma-70 family RNA polymerase sigma factor [Ignavibacteriaceae bacterium]
MHSIEINNQIYFQNNAKSQDLIYRHFAPKMYGICLRFAGNEMEADDILQEGFIKVLTKLKDFRNEGSFEGWIRRTIINTAINYYRKNIRYSKFQDIDECEVPEVGEESIVDKLSKEELIKLVQELPNGYRTVFNLNVIEGYTHKEIGLMLNISDNTSKSQLTRARSILQKKINALRQKKIKVPFEEMRLLKKDNMRSFKLNEIYSQAV